MKHTDLYVVTGGIGSGKSEVCRILKRNYPVLSADEIAREAIEVKEIRERICQELTDAYFHDGVLDRHAFGKWVFSEESRTKALNAIVHPFVYRELERRAREYSGPVFCEIPLYFETGATFPAAGVLVVTADREKRIARVMQRDNISREEVEDRISRQSTLKNAEIAYTVIENNGDATQLESNVQSALARLFSERPAHHN